MCCMYTARYHYLLAHLEPLNYLVVCLSSLYIVSWSSFNSVQLSKMWSVRNHKEVAVPFTFPVLDKVFSETGENSLDTVPCYFGFVDLLHEIAISRMSSTLIR